MHGAMTLDGRRIMMARVELRMLSVAETHAATQGVFIYLDDVDAHCERERIAGAQIHGPGNTTTKSAILAYSSGEGRLA